MLKKIFLIVALFIVNYNLIAQSHLPDPHRFDKEINYFKQYDDKNSFPEKVLLFVGSSSIRLWKTRLAFPDFPVINRGFGGSHISDVLYFYDDIVTKYQPKIIVFYAGDNDVAAGKTVEQVVADFKTFMARIKQDFPQTKVVYIPIKPSVLRWKFWPAMNQVNQKIKQISENDSLLFYIDLASVLLKKDGKPDPDLFLVDGLHLNNKGYQKWNETLRPLLKKLF